MKANVKLITETIPNYFECYCEKTHGADCDECGRAHSERIQGPYGTPCGSGISIMGKYMVERI